MNHALESLKSLFPDIRYNKKIYYNEIKQWAHDSYGASIPKESDRSSWIAPDGGIWSLPEYGPVLAAEVKHQGTNDLPGKKKGSIGNAIERAAKNIMALQSYFYNRPHGAFPYVIFIAGCDFHPSETCYKKIECMTYCFENPMVLVDPQDPDGDIQKILDWITPERVRRKGPGGAVPLCFIKTHTYVGEKAMPHGSSQWKKNEIIDICAKIIQCVIKG